MIEGNLYFYPDDNLGLLWYNGTLVILRHATNIYEKNCNFLDDFQSKQVKH